MRQEALPQSLKNRIVKRGLTRQESSGLFFKIVVSGWILLNVQDTIWSEHIPKASFLRLVVPLFFATALIWDVVRGRGRITPTAFAAFTIIATGFLSSIVGTVPLLAFTKLALYSGILLPLCMATSMYRRVIVSGAISRVAVFAFILVTSNLVALPIARYGFYDNPNKLGMLTVCFFPLMLTQLAHRYRYRRTVTIIGLACCFLIAILTWSRGSVLALAAALTTYVSLRHSQSFVSLLVGWVLLAIIGGLSFTALDSVGAYLYKNRNSVIAATRVDAFQQSMEAWQSRPIFGYGFGLSWLVQADNVADVLSSGRLSWYTVEFGNSTAAMLVGGGIVLTAAFYGTLIVWAISAFGSLRNLRRVPGILHLQISLIAGIIGLLVHSQVEAWLMSPLNWSTVIFWFFIGLSSYIAQVFRAHRPPLGRSTLTHAARPSVAAGA